MFMSFTDIHAAQKLPLEYKLQTAIDAIRQGFDASESLTSLAFSGGKDSTVLWHIIRSHFPREAESMAVIFGNTCIEFPESLIFARNLGKEWGGDNFHEAKPALLEKDGLKYEAQVEVLEWLIKTDQLAKC